MDYNYGYHYKKKEKFDLTSAIANITAAVAVGALTGGAGAAVMAGISSGIGASQMQKGKIDITTNYDERTIANNLTANNININTGNDFNSISTNINGSNIKDINDMDNINQINYNIGKNISISESQEQHQHEEIHNKWGGDIGRAAIGGAITGLASGIGVRGGEYLGNFTSNSINNSILSTSINTSVKSATMSYSTSIGSTMSNTTIYGGDFIYNGKIVTAREAGNILFGRNMENSEMMSNFAIKVLAGGYQFLKDNKINFIDYTKNNNWFRDLGETHEAVRYYNLGIEEQYRKNYDKNPKMENLRQIIKHIGF